MILRKTQQKAAFSSAQNKNEPAISFLLRFASLSHHTIIKLNHLFADLLVPPCFPYQQQCCSVLFVFVKRQMQLQMKIDKTNV